MTEPDRSDGTVGGVGGPAGSAGDAAAVVPAQADSERLLHGVQQDLALLDQVNTREQVPVFDRLHTALADALARTADTAGPAGPLQGRPGA